jgi:hypothetical protein
MDVKYDSGWIVFLHYKDGWVYPLSRNTRQGFIPVIIRIKNLMIFGLLIIFIEFI